MWLFPSNLVSNFSLWTNFNFHVLECTSSEYRFLGVFLNSLSFETGNEVKDKIKEAFYYFWFIGIPVLRNY